MRSLPAWSYIVSIGTLMCPRASPEGVLTADPVPSKKRLIAGKTRFAMALPFLSLPEDPEAATDFVDQLDGFPKCEVRIVGGAAEDVVIAHEQTLDHRNDAVPQSSPPPIKERFV
jgi:hypothetical protein